MKKDQLLFLAVAAAVIYVIFSEKDEDKFDVKYSGVQFGPVRPFIPGGGDATSGYGVTGSW